MWQKEIETCFPDARVDSDEKSFGVLIRREDAASIGDVNNGIYCGVWVDTDKNYKPFWGFYSDSRKMMSEGAREMVADIVKCAGASSKGEEGNYIAWDYTQHGSDRVKSFLDVVNEYFMSKGKKLIEMVKRCIRAKIPFDMPILDLMM